MLSITLSLSLWLPMATAAGPREIATVPPLPGYALVWADEFDGRSLDRGKWDYRGLGPRRDAVNVKQSVRLDGAGHLVLTTRRHGDRVETAMIGTQGLYEPTYGYFECRVRFQREVGHWSAFWLQSPTLGREIGNVADSGTEIDVFEYLRRRGDIVQHTLHWDGYGEHHQSQGHTPHVPGLGAGWHTVGLLWTAEEYRFYVDGQETWRTDQAVAQRSEFLILSLEVGPWAGDIADARLPDDLLVDYVRVFQPAPDAVDAVDGSVTGRFPKFAAHTIDAIGSRLGQTALVDLDRDGDLDWVSGESDSTRQRRLWWWEYRGPDTWVRHDVGTSRTDVGGDAHDVNRDGWVDLWAGETLFLNRGDGTFSQHTVGTIRSHDSVFADINGDGWIDGLANSDQVGLVWYRIGQDPTRAWSAHRIAPADVHKIHGGVSPRAVGDLDGDGDPDVVTGRAWCENRDGKGLTWQVHADLDLGEVHQYGIALRTWVGDLDHDGDRDIVQAEADDPDGRIAWFENDGHGRWTRHLIQDKGLGQDFHSLVVADLDLDGDLDVFSGGGPLSTAPRRMIVWENRAGPYGRPTSRHWVAHTVAEGPCHEAVGADVDGDGDIDLATKPWSTGNTHRYLENRLR